MNFINVSFAAQQDINPNEHKERFTFQNSRIIESPQLAEDHTKYSFGQSTNDMSKFDKASMEKRSDGIYGSFSSTKDPNKSEAAKANLSFVSEHSPTDNGQPIQIVKIDYETGLFSLNTEALNSFIDLYEGNISFVSIIGQHKTGKSFLLNKLLNLKTNAFKVDSNVESCTQGIWIWSKPIYKEQDNLYIFFYDVEGFGNFEKSPLIDAKIFALVMLMSNYIIYNSKGAINENSIKDLSFVTQMSNYINVPGEKQNLHLLSYYAPKFIWALRDFAYEIRDHEGKPIPINNYLESSLTDPVISSDLSILKRSSENNKKIRKALLTLFKNKDCFAFPMPIITNKERDLWKLNTNHDHQIKPQFFDQLSSLRLTILSKTTPKQIKGVNLNIRMYMTLINKYIETFNQGYALDIEATWNHVLEKEYVDGYEQAMEVFEEAIKKVYDESKAKSFSEFQTILNSIREFAFDRYKKFTWRVGLDVGVQELKERLKNYFDQREQQLMEINEELNLENNEKMVQLLSEKMKENLAANMYNRDLKDFFNDFNDFLKNFDLETHGLTKATILVSFLKIFEPEIMKTLVLSLNDNYEQKKKTSSQEKELLAQKQLIIQANLNALKQKEKVTSKEIAKYAQEKQKAADEVSKLTRELNSKKEEVNKKVEEERTIVKQYLEKVEEKEKDVEKLSKENKMLLEQIKRKQNACCNMF